METLLGKTAFPAVPRWPTHTFPEPLVEEQEPSSPEPPQTLWQLVRPHVRPHSRTLWLATLINILPGVGIAFQMVTTKYLLDWVLIPPGLPWSQRLSRLALLLSAWLFSAYFLRMTCWYRAYKVITHVREEVVREVRSRFFRHINSLCLRFHGRQSSGELFSYVLGAPIGAISSFYHSLIMNVPNAATGFLLSSIWIFFWDPFLTAVLLIMVAVTALAAYRSRATLQRLHEHFVQTQAEVAGRVTDIFRANRDVKIHAIEERLAESFDANAEMLREQTCERDLQMHRVNMRSECISYFFFAVVMVLGSWRYLSHAISAGELLAYLAAYGALQGPVGLMFNLNAQRAEAVAGLRRLLELLQTDSSTPDPLSEAQRPARTADFELQNVHFAYEKTPVLAGLNLRVPFGQRVALVGPSGAGKSTLARLLMRLYDPDAGSITLGGVDLRQCRSAEVRRMFGVVPQDPYFFRESIRHNLRIVQPDATEEQLREVCELSNAWEFIVHLPSGLDTVIGEGGCRLSCGQRQRLAIARALLHQPRYFIFDEATSALDSLNERLIQTALNRVLAGRTAFFIAHRLSTIRECDRVLVLDEHRIVQDGSFEELAAAPGLFREMIRRDQF